MCWLFVEICFKNGITFKKGEEVELYDTLPLLFYVFIFCI